MATSGADDRSCWIGMLTRVAAPVLKSLHARKIKLDMPIEGIGDERYARSHFAHLEALGRTLVGLAPWLECSTSDSDPEDKLRRQYAWLAREALDAGTDPASPDVCNFSFSFQPIVDAAFLCHAILRAPTELWGKLEPRVKQNVIDRLLETRSRKPHFNNWLLFAAMIEAGLKFMGAFYDPMRIDYALRMHELWYKGDGQC